MSWRFRRCPARQLISLGSYMTDQPQLSLPEKGEAVKKGNLGQSAGTEKSPERKKRDAARRKREEAKWARRSGPVTVRWVEPRPTPENEK